MSTQQIIPRFVVLGGAGAIGRIIVHDLFESNRQNHIVVADLNQDVAQNISKVYRSRRVTSASADARDVQTLSMILKGQSVVINCTRHDFNLNVMRAALHARVHYLDLGGLFEWTRRQLRLHTKFRNAGLTAILGMGCAPGLTNVMAAAAGAKLERIDSVRIRVGGINLNANADDFAFPYSPRTIIEELTLSAWKWSRGRFIETRPRSAWELIDFGPPVGSVWTVATRHSEIATLPDYFKAKRVRHIDFKVSFDRPFVGEILKRIRSGWTVRDFEALPAPRDMPNDYEVTRLIVKGAKRTIIMDCHARSNPEWQASAGDIDTAGPASIVAQMLAGGIIQKPGVWAPEGIVPAESLFHECRQRGMEFRSLEK